ncbi:Peptidoglycan/LPS O-acetylase OafA/YrhL, contains acyltransferase and SGNH-hydrolase domains [Loktanella fryxellensis]|uniref:Peptidoglycan/LPS O-acetylase OafA/YrhL, contains acyltransferase and SGNH-hydrolase domains n=1 Tax=Loktanella fryxellensis TaxID=245187 RepID=A0A1H8H793_9RHOB|nr:acyltransferase [Loktanella fryxellensis]SEN51408.1 Peptidoglycan/LPS O-acetylase OafA/YrhL, contains acyltransferase and SGNH-hydrolase domains [Loktanella fryxellensis]
MSHSSAAPAVPIPPLVAIDALRAYMAWWVVVGHGLQLTGLGAGAPAGWGPVAGQAIGLLLRGDTAVHVFVIVSGFVMAHLLSGARVSYATYLGRRILRLYPVYAVCILLAVLVMPFYVAAFVDNPHAAGGAMRLDRLAHQSQDLLWHVLLHATLLHGMVPDSLLPYASATFLSPAWSLSLEWQFYLVAPVLMGLLARGRVRIMTGSVLCLLMLQVILQGQDRVHWQFDSNLALAIGYFLLGMLCRIVLTRHRQGRALWPVLCAALAVVPVLDRLAVLIWLVWYAIVLWEAGLIRRSRASGPAATLLAGMVGAMAFNPVAVRLGQWSYATYLVHIPVFAALVGSYGLWVGPAQMQPQITAAILLASGPVIVAASALLYRWVEVPMIRLGRRGDRSWGGRLNVPGSQAVLR